MLITFIDLGRKHQIRSQLSYIGHPIVGDNLYGSSILMGQDKKILYPCLHSSELKFVHPISKQSV
jgi:23S rRNA pseudouridine1911/1915/1917 synthase